MKKQVKKRNPADTTMRNINALKKRLEKLEARLNWIRKNAIVVDLEHFVSRARKKAKQ